MYRSQETRLFRLARRCAVAGAGVIAALIVADAVSGPGGPGPSIVKDQPKAEFARPVRIIPLERSREEKPPQPSAVGAAPSVTQPATVAPALPARSEPTPTFTTLTGLPTPEEAARATRVAQEKIAAEKARKRRLARERARAQAIAEMHKLDQPSYDQQTWFGNAFASRRSFGRSQNSWGNGWSSRDSRWMDRAGR